MGWPALLLLGSGLGLLLLAFKVVDHALPDIVVSDVPGITGGVRAIDSVADPARVPYGMSRAHWLRRKWSMFWLGCGVALLTMSVSVALTVLVPLVARDRVRREEIVPYIMGANITTLVDTLLAAFLLDSAAAVRIVLAAMVGVSTVSVAVLVFGYALMLRGVWAFQRHALVSPVRLAAFTAALFALPLALVVGRG